MHPRTSALSLARRRGATHSASPQARPHPLTTHPPTTTHARRRGATHSRGPAGVEPPSGHARRRGATHSRGPAGVEPPSGHARRRGATHSRGPAGTQPPTGHTRRHALTPDAHPQALRACVVSALGVRTCACLARFARDAAGAAARLRLRAFGPLAAGRGGRLRRLDRVVAHSVEAAARARVAGRLRRPPRLTRQSSPLPTPGRARRSPPSQPAPPLARSRAGRSAPAFPRLAWSVTRCSRPCPLGAARDERRSRGPHPSARNPRPTSPGP
ncbi:hypothetical protein HNR73_001262 [Phytomonospora endophytica]|uniref:Uncharacterized protein n=1 Tax=Phytomonospora endophytica TaxID=714109 RepID=A0A841FDA2_9ACTN|nr:hypothetical protein [Phytomonospora endophytica]